jgi:hypothetical protein
MVDWDVSSAVAVMNLRQSAKHGADCIRTLPAGLAATSLADRTR